MNIKLDEYYEELDTLLSATLQVDDFVNLEDLLATVTHPPFKHDELRKPSPRLSPITEPRPSARREPTKPTGLFGRKKKLAKAQAEAEAEYSQNFSRWRAYVESLPRLRAEQDAHYSAAENSQLKQLANAEAKYEKECADRELEVRHQNTALDELIAGLWHGHRYSKVCRDHPSKFGLPGRFSRRARFHVRTLYCRAAASGKYF